MARQLRKRTALKTSNTQNSGNVPCQEKRQNEAVDVINSVSKNPIATRPRKRQKRQYKNEKITESAATNNRLKSLRLVPDDDEEDFCGFTADVDIIKHNKLKIAIIQCAQAVMVSLVCEHNNNQ